MRAYNASLDVTQRAGFYGMDLYSFINSSNEVLEYLEKVVLQRTRCTSAECVWLTCGYPLQRTGGPAAGRGRARELRVLPPVR
jgi:hypothetical protein